MFSKEKGEAILAPLTGKVIEISEVKSPIFAGKVVGDGIAIVPKSDDGIARSPVSGVVSFIGEQKHSYGVTGYDGIEILIHIGIGTVALDGEGFEPLVTRGQQVKAGDSLCKINWKLISEKGFDLTTPVIITSGSMSNVKRLTLREAWVQAGLSACMEYINK